MKRVKRIRTQKTSVKKDNNDVFSKEQSYGFGEAISTIIKLYKDGSEEALDGDEVDVLTEHLRNELNLFEGNITKDEYLELEERIRLTPTF